MFNYFSNANVTQAGAIITNRIILISGANIITTIGSYHIAWPCDKVAFTLKNDIASTLHPYPECASWVNGTKPSQEAVTHAHFGGLATEVGASLDIVFGMALWVALIVHAVGVKIYVRFSPYALHSHPILTNTLATSHTRGS